MYRRPKFLEILLEVREQMSRDSDFDADLFAERVRSGKISDREIEFSPKKNRDSSPKKKVKK